MKAIGYVPAKGFPRGPNPQAILTEREIPVKIVQLSRSKVSSELLMKGIQGMKTGGRKLMLEDIQKKGSELLVKTLTWISRERMEMRMMWRLMWKK